MMEKKKTDQNKTLKDISKNRMLGKEVIKEK